MKRILLFCASVSAGLLILALAAQFLGENVDQDITESGPDVPELPQGVVINNRELPPSETYGVTITVTNFEVGETELILKLDYVRPEATDQVLAEGVTAELFDVNEQGGDLPQKVVMRADEALVTRHDRPDDADGTGDGGDTDEELVQVGDSGLLEIELRGSVVVTADDGTTLRTEALDLRERAELSGLAAWLVESDERVAVRRPHRNGALILRGTGMRTNAMLDHVVLDRDVWGALVDPAETSALVVECGGPLEMTTMRMPGFADADLPGSRTDTPEWTPPTDVADLPDLSGWGPLAYRVEMAGGVEGVRDSAEFRSRTAVVHLVEPPAALRPEDADTSDAAGPEGSVVPVILVADGDADRRVTLWNESGRASGDRLVYTEHLVADRPRTLRGELSGSPVLTLEGSGGGDLLPGTGGRAGEEALFTTRVSCDDVMEFEQIGEGTEAVRTVHMPRNARIVRRRAIRPGIRPVDGSLRADSLTAWLGEASADGGGDGSGRLEIRRMEADGDVVIEQGDALAAGDRLVLETGADEARRVHLDGAPRLRLPGVGGDLAFAGGDTGSGTMVEVAPSGPIAIEQHPDGTATARLRDGVLLRLLGPDGREERGRMTCRELDVHWDEDDEGITSARSMVARGDVRGTQSGTDVRDGRTLSTLNEVRAETLEWRRADGVLTLAGTADAPAWVEQRSRPVGAADDAEERSRIRGRTIRWNHDTGEVAVRDDVLTRIHASLGDVGPSSAGDGDRGDEPWTLTADALDAVLDPQTRELNSAVATGTVVMTNGRTTATGDRFTWDGTEGRLHGSPARVTGEITLVSPDAIVFTAGEEGGAPSVRVTGEGDKTVSFDMEDEAGETRTVTVTTDGDMPTWREGVTELIFTGDVRVRDGARLLRCRRMIVHFAETADGGRPEVRDLTALGDGGEVVITDPRDPDDPNDDLEVRGTRLDWDATNETVVMVGDPDVHLVQGRLTGRARRAVYRLDDGSLSLFNGGFRMESADGGEASR